MESSFRRAGLTVRPLVPLRELTSFRLGGPCPFLVEATRPEAALAAIRLFAQAQSGFLLIGGGTNLLVADGPLDRPVLRFLSPQGEVGPIGEAAIPAGTALDEVVAAAVRAGLGGIEELSGIPGTVGGAIAGNAGAFGRTIGEALDEVRLCDRSGNERLSPGRELDFGYRSSRLQESGEIVLAARFRLSAADPAALARRREEILSLRRNRHPDWRSIPCAGSFFRNLEPETPGGPRLPAGRLLEAAGAKTLRVGGAAVFAQHANIPIVADPACTAADMFELQRRMREAVRIRFGIDLLPEVRFIGF